MSFAGPTTPRKTSCKRSSCCDDGVGEKQLEISDTSAVFEFPPTPDTSKSRRIVDVDPKGKIRSVSERLMLEVADGTTLAPSTPKLNIILDEMVKSWNQISHEDSSDEELVYREHLDNPFVVGPSAHNSPLVAAAKEDGAGAGSASVAESKVDYSRYNEFITKSGRRVVKKLTSSQQRIKPKRLFTQINDKYVAKRLNKIVLPRDFEIYKDDKQRNS